MFAPSKLDKHLRNTADPIKNSFAYFASLVAKLNLKMAHWIYMPLSRSKSEK